MQLRSVVRALAAGAMASIAAAGTIAAAYTLADYPAPFVSDSTVNTLIVVGEDAHPSDVVGAIDLAARLGAVPQTTKTGTVEVEVPGTSAAVTLSGGVSLDTTGKRIYLGDALNKVKDTLTSADLDILAGDTLEDAQGNQYDYDLYIDIGSNTVVFDQPETDEDPVLMVQMSTSSSSPLYTAKIVFDKEVDFTDGNLTGKRMTWFGNEFTISDDTTDDQLVLFKAAEEVTLNKGDETTVTIGGEEYTIKVVGFNDNKAVLTINGETDDVEEGHSATIGGLRVYAKIVTSWNNGQEGVAVLLIGAEKVVLENGQPVKIGDTEEEVDGTHVRFNEDDTLTGQVDELSTIEILVYAPSDDEDYIEAGSAFTDPVFGTFKVAFNGMVNGPDSEAVRETIKITGDSNSGNIYFTDTEGETKTTQFVYYDSDANTWYVAGGDNNKYEYVLVEGKQIDKDEMKNKYFILGSGDTAHILEVTSVSVDEGDGTTDNDDYIVLTDRRTGATYKIEFEAPSSGSTTKNFYIEGKKYTLTYDADATKEFKITDSDTSTLIVFPTIETSKGAELTIIPANGVDPSDATNDLGSYDASHVAYTTTFTLPTGTLQYKVTDSGSASVTILVDGSDSGVTFQDNTNQEVTIGGVTYIVKADLTDAGSADDATLSVDLIGIKESSGTPYDEPVFLFIEEENEQPTTATQYKIIVPFKHDDDDGVGTVTTTGSIKFTESGVSFKDSSDDDIKYALTSYGTYLKLDVSENVGTLTITYPDEQMYGMVAVGEEPTWSTTEATTGGTVTKEYTYSEVVPITTPIAKLDSEVTDADKTTKHLILVGGPCVNDLVAELAAAEKLKVDNEVLTCEAWNAKTAAGDEFGLIELIENAFADGKVALVVAGSRAPQTREACSVLQDYVANKDKLTGTAVKIVSGVITPVTISE